MQLGHIYFSNPAAQLFFIRSKNNNKNCWEMGLLSLLDFEFASNRLVLKLGKFILKVRQYPKFNLEQLKAYKLIFAIKLSMEK